MFFCFISDESDFFSSVFLSMLMAYTASVRFGLCIGVGEGGNRIRLVVCMRVWFWDDMKVTAGYIVRGRDSVSVLSSERAKKELSCCKDVIMRYPNFA